MAKQKTKTPRKPLPKIKRNVTITDILKKDPELGGILKAPLIFKKQLLQPIKATKDFGKTFKLSLAFTVLEEIPILGLLFGKNRKKKPARGLLKGKSPKDKTKGKKSILSRVLSELKLISKALKGKGKPTKGTPGKEGEDKEGEEKQEGKQTEKEGMSPWLKGGLAIAGLLTFSKFSNYGNKVEPKKTAPAPVGNEPQQEAVVPIEGDADEQLKKLATDYEALPDDAEKEQEKIDKATGEFEQKTGKKIPKAKEPAPEPTAVEPTPAPAPAPVAEAPPEQKPQAEAKPAPAATKPEPKEVPGAIRTQYGVLTDSSGKPITAPGAVPEVAGTKPAPAPTPKQEAKPTPAPTPKPEAKPTPAPTSAPSTPLPSAEKEKPKGLVGEIIKSLKESGIVSIKAISNILATIKAETNFKVRSENLNYTSAERIQAIFGKRRIPTLEFAAQFVGKPEALANEVYKSTDGNKEYGDGWKYRGRGFIQHTGKNQYEGIKKFTGVDVVSNPDLLNDPAVATKALAWFFLSYKRKKPEQLESMSEVNKAVGFADTTGKESEHRIQSAEAIQAKASSGENLESLSENVAAQKKQSNMQTKVVIVKDTLVVAKAA